MEAIRCYHDTPTYSPKQFFFSVSLGSNLGMMKQNLLDINYCFAQLYKNSFNRPHQPYVQYTSYMLCLCCDSHKCVQIKTAFVLFTALLFDFKLTPLIIISLTHTITPIKKMRTMFLTNVILTIMSRDHRQLMCQGPILLGCLVFRINIQKQQVI